MKLAELKGSEKQIAWAFKIRQDFIDKYQGYSDEEVEYFSLTNAQVVRKVVEKFLENEESSKFYIEKLRTAYNLWETIMIIFEQRASIYLQNKNIKYSKKERVYGIIGIKDMGDKLQFIAHRYPSVVQQMGLERAKEIGYNEYGQFIWEKEKLDEEYTLEILEEFLLDLGYGVYID